MQVFTALATLELLSLPSHPAGCHTQRPDFSARFHSANVEGAFVPSGQEVIVSQRFLHHSSLAISSCFLLPSSIPGPFHTPHTRSSIFVPPSAQEERKAKWPAMAAEPRGVIASSQTRQVTQRDLPSKVVQDSSGRPEVHSLSTHPMGTEGLSQTPGIVLAIRHRAVKAHAETLSFVNKRERKMLSGVLRAVV